MLIFRSRTISLVFIISILFSCKKTTVEGPAGPPGPDGSNGNSTITGTVYGKVALFDSLGKAVTDNSGVTILFENTNPQISVTSAVDGSFTSPELSSGTYNLSFSKSGYGTMKLFHFQHTGGVNSSQTGIIEMGKKQSSWFDIKNLKVDTGTGNGGYRYMVMTISLTHPQTLPWSQGIMYFSHAPGVGNQSNDYAYRNVFYRVDDSTMIFQDFGQDLTQYTDQFLNTDYVYVAVALDNPKLFTYTDSTGNDVYPATGNLSNEVKVYNNLKNY
jgi:hypothetical protein